MRSTSAWIWITWTGGRSSTCLTLSSWWSHPTAWRPSPLADARERWTQTTVSRKGLWRTCAIFFNLTNIKLGSDASAYTYNTIAQVYATTWHHMWPGRYLILETPLQNKCGHWLHYCASSSQKQGGQLLCSPAPHRFPPWLGLEVDPWAQRLWCQLLLRALPLPEELRYNTQLGKKARDLKNKTKNIVSHLF